MVHSAAKNSRFAVAKKQIQVDLKRTFAGNDKCWLTSDAGQKSLQRVLLAYALHNDDLGYCQSMTFVVGRLLCLFHNRTSDSKTNTLENTSELPIEEEERVFWILHVLCEDFFPSYYTQGMTGLQVDGTVLEKLMRKRLPKLYRHFQQLHTPPMGLVLVTQWLLPLCCAVFPSETTFRFLDVLFYEGSSVVFAVAIALLRISQHELLAENVDYTQLFRFLRARDQRLHDAPLLMEVAFEEHLLLAAQVSSLRQQAAQELGIDQSQQTSKSASTKKLSKLPGDVDISI
ncbi:putative RabGAP/TBC domain-containing protein [Phytophthora cinnamomi]|uniref:putative RabGAP/TBC domain-containing protein n=1 Tax=Phytophthora cinnamomi TaxID=4785 RepID=UPI0035596B71|nr:putative RabGAP/TBC domain-containing protein [Phytophthora cinnamomi]